MIGGEVEEDGWYFGWIEATFSLLDLGDAASQDHTSSI